MFDLKTPAFCWIRLWYMVIFMLAWPSINPLYSACCEKMPTFLFGSYALDWEERLSRELGILPAPCRLGRFRDGEVLVEIGQNTQDLEVVVIQSIYNHEALMEALLIADALKRDGCKRIIACLPYLSYMRQEKRIQTGTPISARLVIRLLEEAGYDGFIVCDLHAKQIEGFFTKPVYHISAASLFEADILKRFGASGDLVIISPDSGGLHRARSIAKSLKIPLAVVDKYRQRPGESQVLQILGNVRGKICIIVDDMVDSGGTLINAAAALKDRGAREVHCYCTHGILSQNALERIQKSLIDSLTLSDSIPVKSRWDHLRILSVAPLFAKKFGNK
jgi:ribose-phosphate pyrophosphokinase